MLTIANQHEYNMLLCICQMKIHKKMWGGLHTVQVRIDEIPGSLYNRF